MSTGWKNTFSRGKNLPLKPSNRSLQPSSKAINKGDLFWLQQYSVTKQVVVDSEKQYNLKFVRVIFFDDKIAIVPITMLRNRVVMPP